MKLTKTFAASMLTLCAISDRASAAHPPLDRPTPPPCCADGICYPNSGEWGVYRTKWRRWPGFELEPTPAAKPGEAIPDLEPYETLPPELEDRRAPPPTKPRADAEEGVEAPRETPLAPPPGGELDMEPPRSPLTTPPESPLTTPPESPLTPEPSPLRPAPATPFSPGPSTSPLAPPPTRMPWENGNEPTGDSDPPPAPPTATAAIRATVDRAGARQAPNRFTPAQPIRQATPPRQSPAGDPPPTLPVTLASATY